MIVDFRKQKNQNVKHPIVIEAKDVELVDSYKYLGCTLQRDLKCDIHVTKQVKKANKKMYHIRLMSNLRVDKKIICMFYNTVIFPTLIYALCCCYKSMTENEKKSMEKLRKKVCRIVGPGFKDMILCVENIYKKQCVRRVKKIMADEFHPLNYLFYFLPNSNKLNVHHCYTNRTKHTFVYSAIALINEM